MRKLLLALVSLLVVSPDNLLLAEVITFDDLTVPPNNLGTAVPSGYGGLNWTDFLYKNGTENGVGYANGVVSPSNIVYNPNGDPAEVSAVEGTFTLISAYFTAAWRDGLQITVAGYNGAQLVGSEQFTVDTTGPVLETFNFAGITTVDFSSSGGTLHPGYTPVGTAEQFVMDNLSIATPEPSSLVLAAFGAVGLSLAARRRRAA